MSEKKNYVYAFTVGNGKNKQLLGGKGANLCEMTQIGLRVPPGFVITTEACLAYLDQQDFPAGMMEQVQAHLTELEKITAKGFGSAENPLLVSVRSGSAISMPGMMDTILNLGLNSTTLRALIHQTGNERFGYDSYRRFIQLFGKVALGVPDEKFDHQLDEVKKIRGAMSDLDLTSADLEQVASRFLAVIQEHTGRAFPEDPHEQLNIAIRAVFNSWMGKRAVDYRREFKITKDVANGTAVNICTMVFGNMGNDSATGVAFTRNPATGENEFFGEYLVNAQGEDVVAGIRTPKPVAEMKNEMPEIFAQLVELRQRLETHYQEVQDFEFTIEKGILYCLQTRNGKMNAQSMVRTSVEMVQEGLINRERALLRIRPEDLEQLLFPRLDRRAMQVKPIAQGLPASPGAASGQIVFDADRAESQGKLGKKIILLREETKPEDIHGFFAAQGILTSRGGKTSHAAVVARGMGKPCVTGAMAIRVDVQLRKAFIGEQILSEGDLITIDGGSGEVYLGTAPLVEGEFTAELTTLLSWADEIATLQVMANADTPKDAHRARNYGAMGIGLCRTERMFNATDRLPLMVAMIMAENSVERQKYLDQLLPIQRQDFIEVFTVMAPYPVTVRLLDPPIHEFLPSENVLRDEIDNLRNLPATIKGLDQLTDTLRVIDPQLAESAHNSLGTFLAGLHHLCDHTVNQILQEKQNILRKVRETQEINPMLGHRGVRLGITYPEIYQMQIRAVLEATAECVKSGVAVNPEIMVPQVCTAQELDRVRKIVDQVRAEVESAYGFKLQFKFGTMIEVVRACMRANRLAEIAQFFSFGTNDLSQATFSFSREDAENKFLPFYNENGILRDNPFEVLDVNGVGRLMKIAIDGGRSTNPELKVGICGEQGGHPASIRFCQYVGLNYVSCSAPRVPVARLAAAHAKLKEAEFGLPSP